ncbi:MAG: thermonuclease family protein [Parvularculales bacterium]
MRNRNQLRRRAESVFGVHLKKERVRWDKISLISVFILSLTLFCLHHISSQEDVQTRTYPALLDASKQVYDGDTIQDVYIDIADLKTEYPAEVLWLGIFRKDKDIYAITDIRIKGIDTPEKKPATKYKDGTVRPESEREAERAAAALASAELLMLLEGNNLEFVIANPEPDKYFGRVVADVLIDGLNVADYMIEKGLAYRYDGGTKMEFHEWWGKK